MEHLIIKYLNNKLTKEEKSRLEQWLKEDKVNRWVFENMVADWSLKTSEIEDSKRRVHRKLMSKTGNRQPVRRSFSYYTKAAAVLALLLSATWLLTRLDEQSATDKTENSAVKVEKHAMPGQKLTLRLPDGTQVTLNSASKLITPEIFEPSIRKVFLEGEAFFDVAEDASRPFIVETKAADIMVLGTSFNVRSYFDEGDVSVAVNSGKVSVSDRSKADKQVLEKNEMLVYSIEEKSFSKQWQFDKNHVFGWKDQYLVFRDESIREIFKRLSRWYDVDFKVNSNIDEKKRFTAKFKNQTLETVMKSISFSYEFDYEINGKEIIITSKM